MLEIMRCAKKKKKLTIMDFFYKTYLRHLNLFKDKDHFCT